MPCPRCKRPLPHPGLVTCPCGCCCHWDDCAGTVDALRTPTVARLAELYGFLLAARRETLMERIK